MTLNNREIGGVKNALVENLNRACPSLQQATLGNILDSFQSRKGEGLLSIAALQALESDERVDRQERAVEQVGLYLFDAESVQVADGTNIVLPTDVTHPAPGRWKLVSNLSAGFTWQADVISGATLDPVGLTPVEGDRYLINGAGAGGWAGKNNNIAEYTSEDTWIYTLPVEGMTVKTLDDDKVLSYNGATWANFGLNVAIPRTQQAWVDKGGSDTTGEAGNFTRPFLTIAAARAALVALTPAANKRCMLHVGNGEYAEAVVGASFVDLNLGSARIVPAAGNGITLADSMTVFGGIVNVDAAAYCFDVSAVAATPANVIGTQYGATGKVLTTGGGGALVNFFNVVPLPGAAPATFCDTANASTMGNFYSCILVGAMASDDAANLYNCVCQGTWTVGDTINAQNTRFTGAFILTTASAASYFIGSRFDGAFTLLEGTAHVDGGNITGAVLINHANAIGNFLGVEMASTFTVTLGVAIVDGARISGAASIAGTNTNRFAGCTFDATFTVLEATVHLVGCGVAGAVLTNHANAILYSISSILESTLTTTLGSAVVSGGRIAGAIDVSTGAIQMANDVSLGAAITGAPTYLGTPVRDIGGVGFSFIRFTGVPNIDDAFTIGARSYEWDTTGAGVNLTRTPGNVSASLDSAVTEINADAAGAGVVYAIKAAGAGAANGVLILVHEAVGTDFALAVTVDVAVAMTAGHANAVGDFVAARQDSYKFRRTIVAQDVIAFAASEGVVLGCIPSTVAPRYLNLFCTDSTGVIFPINGYKINANQVGAAWYEIELVDAALAALFAAGDFAYVEAQV